LPAAIGTACHRVLQRLVEERWRDGDRLDEQVEVAWCEEAAKAREEAVASALPGEPLARARLKKAARALAEILAQAGEDAQLVCEERASALSGKLVGQPDLVVRSSTSHWVVDYKSGSARDAAGDPREHYITQVQLYCVLEHERTGLWPSKGVVLPLRGQRVDVEVDPERCVATARAAVAALDAYNERAPEPQPARPSAEHCRWCQGLARCDSVWTQADPEWAEENVFFVRGPVTKVVASEMGTTTLQVRPTGGTLPEPLVWLRGMSRNAHPALERVSEGTEVIAGRMRPDRDPGVYRLAADGLLVAGVG
jgi:CRISPR/Cas system-associated exonuclease Cas4 (RecB family)